MVEGKPRSAPPRHIAVVTGTREDFTLLRPVMRAILARADLRLSVIAAGTHLLPPARSVDEVADEFEIAATVDMQFAGEGTAIDGARALGRGVSGFADSLAVLQPEVLLVIGDDIEALAAATAASIASVRIAHLLGGDRTTSGIGEAVRHAITKLSHIHLPATPLAVERIIAMGEEVRTVHMVGSPALDDIDQMPPASDDLFRRAGKPEMIFLMQSIGRSDEEEFAAAQRVLGCCMRFGNILALRPNPGPGSAGIARAIKSSGCAVLTRLTRNEFIGLLRRAGLIVGNSGAGVIEAAVLGAWCINLGPRQAGRDRARNTVDVEDDDPDPGQIDMALQTMLFRPPYTGRTPWGDGRTGPRTAEMLATFEFLKHPLRKRCSY
jgi:UDP-hydrolysing UDP-N-acetyl-D-glucosamine 2-epimerase